MSYVFELPIDPDVKLTMPSTGTVRVEFIHVMSLLNLTEELEKLETTLLHALGYGEQSIKGPTKPEEKE